MVGNPYLTRIREGLPVIRAQSPRNSRVISVLYEKGTGEASPFKGHVSVRTSPAGDDQAIKADLPRREVNSREAGTYRNALELSESVCVPGGRSC
jgi:hypothetical protein